MTPTHGTDSTPGCCPHCKTPLAAAVLDGHCPNCLLALAKVPAGSGSSDTLTLQEGAASAGGSPGTHLRYFGNYELLGEVARGGMGVVYRARQTKLNRVVAVKMILGGQLANPASVQRFLAEASAAANLQHPNIVAIHEVGQHEGQYYFSMDYVEGQNLAELIRARSIPATRAAQWLKVMAEAIHYAHQRGTLHRDLKPHNVLIDASEQPRITDFGLAKQMEQDSGLTRTGSVLGSPSYMPPEQAGGRLDQMGPASDVYSLGAVLYELLTGHAPFRAETPIATLRKVMEEDPSPPSKLRPNLPADLETICLKCLEKKPERRYASARALAEELGRFLNQEPILARPASVLRKAWSWSLRHPWFITGVASALLLALVGLAYGLWEQVRFLKWSNTHPSEKLPFELGSFFSPAFTTFLTLEFFVLQALPLTSFLYRRGRVQLTRAALGGWSALGALQLGFGLYVLARAVAAGTWVSEFWGTHFWLAAPALSNAWFGASLNWLALREYRTEVGEDTSDRSAATVPILVGNPWWVLAVAGLEWGVFAFLAAGRSQPDPGMLVAYLSALGMTGATVAFAAVRMSRVLDATTFLPLLVGNGLLGLLVLQQEWPTIALAYSLGVFFGLGLLKLGRVTVAHRRASDGHAGAARWRLKVGGVTLGACVVLAGMDLVGEHWYGRHALGAWKARTPVARRSWELFKAPAVVRPGDAEKAQRLVTLARKLPHGDLPLGQMGGRPEARPGEAHISSRSDIPFAGYNLSWEELDQKLRPGSEIWNEMTGVLRDAPRNWVPQGWRYLDLSHQVAGLTQAGTPPDLVALRTAAQWGVIMSLNDLHRGDRAAFERDLIAQANLTGVFADSPELVVCMIRFGMTGIAFGPVWEALQLPDWGEPALRELQRAWERSELLSDLARGLLYVQALHLERFEFCRQQPFHVVKEHARAIAAASGSPLPSDPPVQSFIHEYVFHPLWRFAWAQKEQLAYLQTGLADAGASRQPFASWRFYFEPPCEPTWRPGGASLAPGPAAPLDAGSSLSDVLNQGIIGVKQGLAGVVKVVHSRLQDFGASNFVKARQTAVRYAVERNMCVVAIALKRYQLRHGKLPATLESLAPDFLSSVPTDLMDGRPLRYRLLGESDYLLYSVGMDGKDDGGDPTPGAVGGFGIWKGRDALWPRVAVRPSGNLDHAVEPR